MGDGVTVDMVLEWDVTEGGLLGALIVCRDCGGHGRALEMPVVSALPYGARAEDFDEIRVPACELCSGDGRLHRPYVLPAATAPASTPWELAMVQARDRMAAGLGIPPELILLEGIEVNRPAPVVDLVEALDAAVDLMVQRIKVLRRVRREEIERRDRETPPTQESLEAEWLAERAFRAERETRWVSDIGPVEQAEQGEDEGNKG